MGCLPGILSGQTLWAVDKSSWVPGQMLFNKAAFEDPSMFNFYQGSGTRITNLRGFGYWNEDMGLSKVIDLSERFHAIRDGRDDEIGLGGEDLVE